MAKFAKIAIDGPAGSGKSSVGLRLANRLDYLFLDTGVMYRAVTWAAINKKIDIYDEFKVSQLVEKLIIKIEQPSINDGRANDIFVDGVDVTWKIKEPRVNNFVSQVSKYLCVRDLLTLNQRKIANQGNIVMVGRDIGTIVLPKADYKFFLDATEEERTKRRFEEEIRRGESPDYQEILKNIKKRDLTDSTRDLAPLLPAKNAVIIKTDNKSIDQVVEEILMKIHQ